MAQPMWRVHKFGGTSVADAACFRRVASILLNDRTERQAVVVSAMARTTDSLLSLVAGAETSAAVEPGVVALRARYRATVAELLPAPAAAPVLSAFEADLADAGHVLRAIALVRYASDRARDLLAGLGELWSSRLLAAYLTERCQEEHILRSVRWIDTRQVIVVEHGDLGPVVQWEESRQRAVRHFGDLDSGIAVVTGFIASDRSGLYTTLGRNGSDFSASIVGALVDASDIVIWTDVDGVMSADPARVPEAAVIRELSYNEAMELTYFGAKVIHPQTMAPAVTRAIPIYIKNTFNPAASGSRIGPAAGAESPGHVKGVTSIDDVALVNLEGTGMIGVPGTADRLFGALRTAGISVILISQASSEHSICCAVPSRQAARVAQVVRGAFALEMQQGQIQSVDVQPDCSIIAVVGDGMAGLPGVAAKFLSSLGNAGINVRAIAQGSSERNISAVIDNADATRALRAAHSGFYLSAKTLSLGLIGPGHVGGTLLDQMAAQSDRLLREFGVDLRIRAIASSNRMHLADRSFDLTDWRRSLGEGGQPLDWHALSRHVHADHLPHAAIIDCTASPDVASRYAEWLREGIHVVTPNKRALSGPLDQYDRLQTECRRHHRHLLYETTVGAALPVVGTLRDLIQTGDEILRIEGILSGTIAYLFNVLDGTRPFSEIVRDARDRGYTEPDPRDDLSGMDFARKLIILGREMGMRLELPDVEVESLVPEGLGGLTIDEFLGELPRFDDEMLARWKAARRDQKVLRYVGRLGPDVGATVRLEALPADHPFAHMNLTDNIVRYVSRRYSANPLVVQGPGAGPAVTAAGVFADVLRLVSYLGPSR